MYRTHILDDIIGQIVTITLIDRDSSDPRFVDACVTDIDDGWIAYEIDGHMNYTQLSEVETIMVKGTIN